MLNIKSIFLRQYTINNHLILEPLKAEHLNDTLRGRNLHSIRTAFFNTNIISPNTHYEWFLAYERSIDQCMFAILFRGHIAGQIGIYGYNHESRGLELGRLFILPEFQRLGLMSNTLNYIINIIKTKSQIDYINLYCKPLNKSALSLYQSLGFKKDYLDFVLDEKGDKFFLRVR